ncbi:uncharacterized protein BX663DRAFT_521912 [Cokeromyces recurvatus]|uniref:uncharacterized protein n=1 Tax=Cokeromyces recurvatus TaxID=90255 RepID=UPI00221F526E|nr:uncharacterized protein BX663DRAFT_521912 [Cokeromyces recurvatus]KAI7899239.1 hypothetical protein BX663DRAFT_521912 [Cokeromyces recurvatus]
MSLKLDLNAFLNSIGLEQYYEAFIKAGATNQALSQLIQFNDEELNELLSAIDMLPFHVIQLKRAIKEYKKGTDNTPDRSLFSSFLTYEFIQSNSIIYGKNKNRRPLTAYEEAINHASLQIALENPLILISKKRGDLFDLAKKKLLDEGYRYKRGSSRSKLYSANSKSSSSFDNNRTTSTQHHLVAIRKKREENAQRASDQRCAKIRDLQYHLDTLIQSRNNIYKDQKKAMSSDHDRLSQLALEAELVEFEETKKRLTKEISKLKAQERKHQWYKRRKLEKQENEEQSMLSSQSSCSSLDTLTDQQPNHPFSTTTTTTDKHHDTPSLFALKDTDDSITLPPLFNNNTVFNCPKESDIRSLSFN